MESSARLDYVLFHLTPTRTRCDLVIFAGKLNEKLAYGLLEPFIAHLRAAKDQISKGGYSVTLRPPSPANTLWFTKGTLLRFVRFVSTPEVLERFITIEREILQLENSIKSYEASNADGGTEGNAVNGNSKNSAALFKSYGEPIEGEQEENSKARLQRVVETRQVVLRKEQAMVYARALAAGFEMDNLHDLLMFSDAFGASRLREACINFNELCKKKNEDRLWVDEIAAMQAMMQPELSYIGTSGIILAGEDNDPSQNFGTGGKQNGSTDASLSDSFTSNGSSDANQGQTQTNDAKMPRQNPWANQFPQYLRNLQGPMYQQMPPYQGYGFPGMQVAPQYYPANMPWPSDVNGSTDREINDRRDRKSSSRKKGKASKARGSDNEEHSGSSEPSGSSSETDTDSSSEKSRRKKHGKKSSRKVVIRNINYISSKRDEEKSSASESDSSGEESYSDGDSLKQQLEEAVGSFEKHQKSNSHRHKKRSGSKHLGSINQDDEVVSSQNKSGKKGNDNWGALQDLLLKEESDSTAAEQRSVGLEECFDVKRSEELNSYAFKLDAEELTQRKPVAVDDFMVTEMGTRNHNTGSKIPDESFEHSEIIQPVVRRGATPEEFMLSQRSKEPESYLRMPISDDDASLSVIRSHASDDWYISKQSDDAVNQGGNSHLRFTDGDYVKSSNDQIENKNKDFIDDSLMLQGRLADDYSESQLRTDISLVPEIVDASFIEKGSSEVVPQKNTETAGFYEPDELYMVLDRDSVVEQTVPSWSPELDFENNVSAKKSDVDACPDLTVNENSSNNKKNGGSVTKASGRDARSRMSGGPLRKGKPETTPGTRRSTFGSKTTTSRTQTEKDEERRKRLEQLVIQRQKRIAERSGASSVSSRKPQAGHIPGIDSLSDKSKLRSSGEETKKPKPILRSSTIERLAAAKTIPKAPTAQPKKEAPKVKRVNATSGSRKTTGTDHTKLNKNKINLFEKKVGNEIANGINASVSVVTEAKATEGVDATVPAREWPSLQGLNASEEVDDSEDNEELHIASLVINKDINVVEHLALPDVIVSNPLGNHSSALDSATANDDETLQKSLSFAEKEKASDDCGIASPGLSVHPVPESPTKHLSSALIIEQKKVALNGNISGSPEISVIEETTTPTNGMILESTQSRKKWDGPENSPKSVKGFRKLLMFGRKS